MSITRRALLALSAGAIASLAGCAGGEPGPRQSPDPGAQTQPVQLRITVPASYLAFTGNTADEAALDYADYSDGGIGTSVLDDGSLELYVTDHWYGQLRAMWEDELDKSLDSLGAGDDVASVEVAEGHEAVTVTARPSFAERADADLYRLVAACGFLQILDPESDWQGDWAVEVALVDAETGAEGARAALPVEELSYSRESWDEAVSAGA